MPTNTTNYKLKKPATTDYVTIADINANMDKIDTQMKANADAIAGKAGTSVATQSANGLMSSTDKSKLDGIATGANKTIVDSALSDTSTNPVQNKVIHTALLGKQDALTAGSNISIVDNVISAVDTKYGVATQSANGLMSSTDKKKLDSIAESTDLSLAFNESTNTLTVTVNGTSQTVTLYSSAEGGSY